MSVSVERIAYSVEGGAKKTQSFKDLIAWQKSYCLAKEIYEVTNQIRSQETYGLIQQLRRAAVSIPSNIAEGYGRGHPKEYRQFLSIAYGSVCELETQYLLCVDLLIIPKNPAIESLIKEVGSILYRLIHPIRSALSAPR